MEVTNVEMSEGSGMGLVGVGITSMMEVEVTNVFVKVVVASVLVTALTVVVA